MKALTSIVAVNPDGAIGAGNRLPWRVRSDLRFFRESTLNSVVIMGRRTFDSLGRVGLPNRKNIVVAHGYDLLSVPHDCRIANSIEEAIVSASDWRTQRQPVFIVGGASMYEQFAPYVDRYLVTVVKKKRGPDADTFLLDTIFGDEREWNVKLIKSGDADGVNDEADFDIFEWIKRDASDEFRRRELIVSESRRRRSRNAFEEGSWSHAAAE